MQLSVLQTYIGANFGRVDTATEAMILEEINLLLTQQLPRMRLKPFVKVDTTLECTASQEYVDLPADFRQMFLMQWRVGATDDWVSVRALHVADLGDISTGDPVYGQVVLQSNGVWRFYFLQTPKVGFLLRLFYYAAETALADPTDEANLSKAGFDDVITSGATYRVALRLKLRDEIAIWGRQFNDYVAELRSWQGNIWGVQHEFEVRNLYT